MTNPRNFVTSADFTKENDAIHGLQVQVQILYFALDKIQRGEDVTSLQEAVEKAKEAMARCDRVELNPYL